MLEGDYPFGGTQETINEDANVGQGVGFYFVEVWVPTDRVATQGIGGATHVGLGAGTGRA